MKTEMREAWEKFRLNGIQTRDHDLFAIQVQCFITWTVNPHIERRSILSSYFFVRGAKSCELQPPCFHFILIATPDKHMAPDKMDNAWPMAKKWPLMRVSPCHHNSPCHYIAPPINNFVCVSTFHFIIRMHWWRGTWIGKWSRYRSTDERFFIMG